MAEICAFPPGFNRRIYLGTPRRHRQDLIQEAWLAYLSGKNPNTASRTYVAREMHHEHRQLSVSQMSLDQRRSYERAAHRSTPRRRVRLFKKRLVGGGQT